MNLNAAPWLYRTSRLSVSDALQEAVKAAVLEDCATKGLEVGDIEALNPRWLRQGDLQDLLQEVAARMGLPRVDASLIYCETALPHLDADYNGTRFVSVVLHTGPVPYLVQSFLTREVPTGATLSGEPYQLERNSRILAVGDVFVLNPVVPHMAIPTQLHPDSLLVLMQWELPHDQEGAADFLARFPTAEGDCEQTGCWDAL